MQSRNWSESRVKRFMIGFDNERVRRRKQKIENKIRKNYREMNVQRIRNLRDFSPCLENDEEKVALGKNGEDFGKNEENNSEKIESIEDYLSLIRFSMISSNYQDQLFAAEVIMKIILPLDTTVIQSLIEFGMLHYLLVWLKKNEFADLQLTVLLILSKICNTFCCRLVVERGFLETLLLLVESKNIDLKFKSIYIIALICRESAEFRNYITQNLNRSLIVSHLKFDLSFEQLKVVIFLFTGLCTGLPDPSYDDLKFEMKFIISSLIDSNDSDIIRNSMPALFQFTSTCSKYFEEIINSKFISRIIELCSEKHNKIQYLSLKVLGNVLTGEESLTQLVIQKGGIEILNKLFDSSNKKVKIEVIWAISNICAGNCEQLDLVLNHEIFQKIMQNTHNTEIRVIKEIVWVICNSVAVANEKQLQKLIQFGIIQSICNFLNLCNSEIIYIALQGLEKILERSKKFFSEVYFEKNVSDVFEESNGLNHIEKLQFHANQEIYHKASEIIQKHFEKEQDEDELIKIIEGFIDINFNFL